MAVETVSSRLDRESKDGASTHSLTSQITRKEPAWQRWVQCLILSDSFQALFTNMLKRDNISLILKGNGQKEVQAGRGKCAQVFAEGLWLLNILAAPP